MITVSEYALSIIQDLIQSHKTLISLSDKPGDLDTIRREWHRSVNLAAALAGRIDASKHPTMTLENLARKCKKFSEYDFTREIDLLYGLYSNDPNRLKNIRIKILEAFEESKLAEQMRTTLEELDHI